MFGLTFNEVSPIIVVAIGLLTIFEKVNHWFSDPHIHQNKEIENIKEKLQFQDDRINKLQQGFTDLKGTLNKIETNHLVHLQEDVNGLKESNAAMRTDLKWIIGKLNG